MEILTSEKFSKYPEIVFGFSTIKGGVSPAPFGMNLSIATNDTKENVYRNREIFFERLGINIQEVNFQKQVHSTDLIKIESPGFAGDCDATFTDKPGVFLTVSVADCLPVFIYDPVKKNVAGIHAGWRGTADGITLKTIEKIKNDLNSNPEDMIVFVGPCISQDKFEVGEEVGELYNEDVKFFRDGKYFIDIRSENVKQLLKAGVVEANIEHSSLCTFSERELLHSYRRDGKNSGRMFGVIGMKIV